MGTFLVTWRTDVDADSPQKAALRALAMQRDEESMATVFDVTDKQTGKTTEIDLEALQWLI